MRQPTIQVPLVFVAACGLLAGCGDRGEAPGGGVAIITPKGPLAMPAWTAEELAKPVSPHRLHGDEHSTTLLIHLATGEKPHTHEGHDLAVVLVSGSARMHLGERVETMRPGDVVEIPRGTVHWAENASADPAGCVAYAIFTPGYDGTDTHPVPSP